MEPSHYAGVLFLYIFAQGVVGLSYYGSRKNDVVRLPQCDSPTMTNRDDDWCCRDVPWRVSTIKKIEQNEKIRTQ